jgi:hypothetical protein
MSSSASSLLNELAAVKAHIDAARDFVKDGHMPDLTSLEKRIADLCAGIQAAEADEQGQCLMQLASLLKSLDECERDMRAWYEERKAAGKAG